tara:strand:+ start:361 stop:579 length:219 start_codon:yes stop_codon:yes gene_type:complete
MMFGLFNSTNNTRPIIVIEPDYAALQAKPPSSYIKYEDKVIPGGMVQGSWSIGGESSYYTYECSGIAGATDC